MIEAQRLRKGARVDFARRYWIAGGRIGTGKAAMLNGAVGGPTWVASVMVSRRGSYTTMLDRKGRPLRSRWRMGARPRV